MTTINIPTTADDTQAAVESMTAEELLRELEGLAPPEAQADAEAA
jgi:hypothetical protein